MNAIRVYVDATNTDWVGAFVESLNDEEDIVSTMVCATELFIATDNKRAMSHVQCMLELTFGEEFSVQYVK